MHSSSNRELFVFFIETKNNKSRILKNKPTKKKSNNTHTHAHTQKPTCTKKTNNQVKNRNWKLKEFDVLQLRYCNFLEGRGAGSCLLCSHRAANTDWFFSLEAVDRIALPTVGLTCDSSGVQPDCVHLCSNSSRFSKDAVCDSSLLGVLRNKLGGHEHWAEMTLFQTLLVSVRLHALWQIKLNAVSY